MEQNARGSKMSHAFYADLPKEWSEREEMHRMQWEHCMDSDLLELITNDIGGLGDSSMHRMRKNLRQTKE